MEEIGALLTTKEVAKLLRLTPNTVKTLFKDGKIKGAFKIANEWRIPEKSLEEYIKELQQEQEQVAIT